MEKAVTNATVLIFLAKIGRLDLLKVCKTILTTKEIYTEVLEAKDIPLKEKEDLRLFFTSYINIHSVSKQKNLDLGRGEVSALSLCVEQKILLFLSDDKKARKYADLLGVQCVGTMGIILENLRQKKLTKETAKELFHLLLRHSYYISTDVYARTLDLVDDLL